MNDLIKKATTGMPQHMANMIARWVETVKNGHGEEVEQEIISEVTAHWTAYLRATADVERRVNQ